MVLVRMVFHAKLGSASQVVAGMKAMAAQMQVPGSRARHVRILTDLSGRFDTVVQELEYDTMDGFQKDMAEMSSAPQPEGNDAMWMEHMEGGYKEYYTIEFDQ